MNLKNFIFILLSVILVNISYAGNPTISHSISSLNNPIVVGEDVYFSSMVNTNSTGICEFDFTIDFGPFANQQLLFYNSSFFFNGSNSFSQVIGPIVFNSPEIFNITQYLNESECPVNNVVFGLPIEVLPAPAIPTLSQWGLIIVAFFLMIFGIVSLKKKEKVVTT